MIQLRLFGPADLRRGSGDGPGKLLPSQPKQIGLLAYLGASSPSWRACSRDTLLGLFWPELDESRARAALNQAVYRLRGKLGSNAILSQGEDGLALSREHIWCDVPAFREALKRGDHEEALRLHRGPFLEGFYLTGLGGFERWAEEARSSLTRDATDAAWSLAERAAPDGEALGWARRAVSLGSEMNEPDLRRLLTLYDRLGDRSGALGDYERFAARLAEEYGAEPSPETVALMEEIRERSEARTAAPLSLADDDARSNEPPVDPLSDAPWPPLRPPPSTTVAATRRGRSLLAAGALMVAVLGGLLAWSSVRPRLPTPGRVAVVPFSYSGAPELGHTAEGATFLLAANLDGVTDLRTVDAQALAAALESVRGSSTPDGGRAVAAHLGAQYVVTGSVTQAGARVRVSAAMSSGGNGGDGVRVTAEGSPEELFAIVDRVTAGLLAGRRPGPAEAMFRSATRTTGSFAALEAFIQGEAHYRAGRHASAAQAFQQATVRDSTFALAYMRLSQAQSWIGTSALQSARQAVRHGDRLSASARREVEAWDLYLRGRVLQAERLYREVLRDDSASVAAWVALGEIDYHWGSSFGRPPEEARGSWEKALALDPANVGVMLHLARIAARERRRSDFDELRNGILALSPPVDTRVELTTTRAFAFGTRQDREAAVVELRQLPSPLDWNLIRSVGSISWGLADAGELLMVRTSEANPAGISERRARNLSHRAGLLLATGRLAWASALLDSASVGMPEPVLAYRAASGLVPLLDFDAVQLAHLRSQIAALPRASTSNEAPADRNLLYVRGALAARLGEHAEALAVAEALEARQVDPDGSWSQLGRLIRAESLRQQGRPAEALALLDDPTWNHPTRLPRIWHQHRAAERFLRGELLAETGQLRAAVRWFATFPDPMSYDALYLPAAELRQAQLLVRLGQPEAAAPHLQRLAVLWHDADPEAAHRLAEEIAEVTEAARRRGNPNRSR